MMKSTIVSASSAKQTIIAVAAVNQLRCFIRAACVLFCSDGGDKTQIAVCAELVGAKLWRGRSLKGWSLSKLLVLIKATRPCTKMALVDADTHSRQLNHSDLNNSVILHIKSVRVV